MSCTKDTPNYPDLLLIRARHGRRIARTPGVAVPQCDANALMDSMSTLPGFIVFAWARDANVGETPRLVCAPTSLWRARREIESPILPRHPADGPSPIREMSLVPSMSCSNDTPNYPDLLITLGKCHLSHHYPVVMILQTILTFY